MIGPVPAPQVLMTAAIFSKKKLNEKGLSDMCVLVCSYILHIFLHILMYYADALDLHVTCTGQIRNKFIAGVAVL